MVGQIAQVIVFQWPRYLEKDSYPLKTLIETRSLSAFSNDIGHLHTK
jgi:hypothetical protein